MLHYRHTQVGVPAIVVVLVLLALVGSVGAIGGSAVPVVVAAAVLVLVGVLFSALTTEIADGELRCSFGPGWIRRRIPLVSIEDAVVVRNRWWYGWGVRLTPYGWMFNVSGLDAVQLHLRSGRRFRVGTDRPGELARALREAIGMADRPPGEGA